MKCKPNYCKYCEPEKNVIIFLEDVNGKELEKDRWDTLYYDRHCIKLRIKKTLTDDDLVLIRDLIDDKFDSGLDVYDAPKYLELFEKIGRMISGDDYDE